MRNYEQELFDLVYALHTPAKSPVHKDEYSIYSSDFKLEEIDQLEEMTYRVFVKGGIQFEITRTKQDGKTEYTFYSIWEGVLNCSTAQSILAVFIILGIKVVTAGGEENK